MLLNGEDGSNYDANELGLFKSVLSAAKKVGGAAASVGSTAAKVATAPITKVTIPVAKTTLGLAAKVGAPALLLGAGITGASLLAASKATGAGSAPAATNMVQEIALPSCGFWSRLRRAFGANVTDCT